MTHLQLAFVNEQRLAQDHAKEEARGLRLRSLYGVPAQEEWRRALYQAADILEHFGWCRGTLERGNRHCALGAILAARNEGDVHYESFAASAFAGEPAVRWMVGKVTRCLDNRADSSAQGLMGWNDSRAKDGKEVAALLRAAAAQS